MSNGTKWNSGDKLLDGTRGHQPSMPKPMDKPKTGVQPSSPKPVTPSTPKK